ncbi:MAG: pyruvate dehydrogenase complex dihydrolipoamide acetyltransferase [Paracoccaceae bacterium]|jgi:pyruvate dehydrogenase E2 component (dihydrolipoamide acetyltransferase)|nr:pyruvate dehydrogenase complex dihydrolipoamide acetyltransferase [Paracoccaceae bacterium]
MPIEILMPALSPTMEQGSLTKWLVKAGDTVASGDLLAEIETDKATMEFEAVDEGIIGEILIPEGSQDVAVNTPIATLLDDDETADGPDHTASAPASLPVRADTSAIATLDSATPADAVHKPVTPTATLAPTSQPDTKTGRVFATPLARRIAADKGLDLSQIIGSGPKGRIVKADVENATAAAPAPATNSASTAVSTEQIAISSGPATETVLKMYGDRTFDEIKLDGMRKTIAARLTEAKQTIPHFYLRRDIQLDALLALRSELNSQLATRDVKLSVNDFIIKAAALALQSVPAANAVWAGDRVLQLKPSDVAVAVAIEGGLFTPVLKDADSKSLSTLSAEMKDMANRARNKKLAPHEYQGGSFAISNLGMFGVDNFDAVINPPHGAILAVGAGKKRPVVTPDGSLGVATVMSVTMSVDHRAIDGALGAQLLQAIVDNLENPLTMLV